jgi:hypothetical protein
VAALVAAHYPSAGMTRALILAGICVAVALVGAFLILQYFGARTG